MKKPPNLASVNCSRIRFQPGDRVLVEVYRKLDEDQKKKLRRTVQRWTGPDVEVLIYNALEMRISVEKRR